MAPHWLWQYPAVDELVADDEESTVNVDGVTLPKAFDVRLNLGLPLKYKWPNEVRAENKVGSTKVIELRFK